jgi:predicted nucleic acid-binding protein
VIVADCTLIARLIIAADDATAAQELWLRDPAWAAPTLWQAEFANVLLKYERAGFLTAEGATARLFDAENVMSTSTHHVAAQRALATARDVGCSAYDAFYVALAEDLGAKLYTYDKQLLKKCRGIALEP